jgi:HK97 family phage major capsid protein
MTSIQALRERRSVLAKTLNDLLDEEKSGKWNNALQEKYDAGMNELDEIDGQVGRITSFHAKVAEDALNGNPDGLLNETVRTPGTHESKDPSLRAFLVGGFNALTPEAMQAVRSRQTPDIRNAMSTTTGSEGGFTVASEYYRQLTEALKLFGGIRSAATILQTGTGAQMNFPTTDATTEVGEIVGQNTQATLGETTFGNVTMDVYKYSSKSIALPFELLQDSMFDLDSYIQRLLAVRIGRITSTHFTTGTGTAQPHGIVTRATSGKVGATGSTLTCSYDDLVDLEHSVDPLYRARPGVGFMMHDNSLRVVRKIKDTQGRPIFVPGYEQGNPGGAPDRLLGRPIYISQEMAVMAANAKSILFGDLRSYFLREVMDLTLFRMTDSAYTLKGQVGFVAFNRQGGNLIDTTAVKFYQNSAT